MKKISVIFTFSILLFCSICAIGQDIVWLNELRYSGGNYAEDMSIDSSGNSYVGGNYTLFTRGIFLVKYDQSGDLQWSDTVNGTLVFKSMVTDVNGNSYVAGSSEGTGNTVTFGAYSFTSMSYHDMFLVKYNTSGTVVWLKHFIRTDVSKIAISSSGNLFIGGSCAVNTTFDSLTLSGPFIVKIDTAGNCISGYQSLNYPDDFALDGSENIFMINMVSYTPVYDYRIRKYDINGNLLWTVPGANMSGKLAADQYGNCFYTGLFNGSITFNSTTLHGSMSGGYGAFMCKLDSAGNYTQVISADNVAGRELCTVGSEVYVVDFSPSRLIVGKFDTMGVYHFIDSIPPGTHWYYSTAVIASQGNVYVCGYTQEEGPSAFVAKISNSGVGISDPLNNLIFQVYPNPASESIIVSFSDIPARCSLRIVNTLGQDVYHKKLESNTTEHKIDLSGYPQGLYIIELVSEGKPHVRKFIVD